MASAEEVQTLRDHVATMTNALEGLRQINETMQRAMEEMQNEAHQSKVREQALSIQHETLHRQVADMQRRGVGGGEGPKRGFASLAAKELAPEAFGPQAGLPLGDKLSKWREWSYKMRNWIGAIVDPKIKMTMKKVENMKNTIEKHDLINHGVDAEWDAHLHAALTNKTIGEAHVLVQSLEDETGLEIWRQLAGLYDPDAPGRNLAEARKLMNFGRCQKLQELRAHIQQYEMMVTQRYLKTGTKLDDDLMVSGLLAMCPTDLEKELEAQQHLFPSYEKLKGHIHNVIVQRGAKEPEARGLNALNDGEWERDAQRWEKAGVDDSGTELFRLVSSGGPRRGDKGGGKGELKKQKECYACGRAGHIRRSCTETKHIDGGPLRAMPSLKGKGKGRGIAYIEEDEDGGEVGSFDLMPLEVVGKDPWETMDPWSSNRFAVLGEEHSEADHGNDEPMNDEDLDDEITCTECWNLGVYNHFCAPECKRHDLTTMPKIAPLIMPTAPIAIPVNPMSTSAPVGGTKRSTVKEAAAAAATAAAAAAAGSRRVMNLISIPGEADIGPDEMAIPLPTFGVKKPPTDEMMTDEMMTDEAMTDKTTKTVWWCRRRQRKKAPTVIIEQTTDGEDQYSMDLCTTEEEVDLMPFKPETKPMRELREITVDSGAGQSVMNPEDMPGVKVEESEGSRKGLKYKGPGSEVLPNLGQMVVTLMTLGGLVGRTTWQAAKVRKPLMAVSAINDKGNMVVFDSKGSAIIPGNTAEARQIRDLVQKMQNKIDLERKNGVFTLKAWLTAPGDNQSGFTRQGR